MQRCSRASIRPGLLFVALDEVFEALCGRFVSTCSESACSSRASISRQACCSVAARSLQRHHRHHQRPQHQARGRPPARPPATAAPSISTARRSGGHPAALQHRWIADEARSDRLDPRAQQQQAQRCNDLLAISTSQGTPSCCLDRRDEAISRGQWASESVQIAWASSRAVLAQSNQAGCGWSRSWFSAGSVKRGNRGRASMSCCTTASANTTSH